MSEATNHSDGYQYNPEGRDPQPNQTDRAPSLLRPTQPLRRLTSLNKPVTKPL